MIAGENSQHFDDMAPCWIALDRMLILMEEPTIGTPSNTYFDEWIGLMDEFHDYIMNHKQLKINLEWHRGTIEAMVK